MLYEVNEKEGWVCLLVSTSLGDLDLTIHCDGEMNIAAVDKEAGTTEPISLILTDVWLTSMPQILWSVAGGTINHVPGP